MMMMVMSGEPVETDTQDIFYLAGLHSRGEDAGCGGRGQLGAAQVSTKL